MTPNPSSNETSLAYFLGLDLGQASDYTALTLIERHGQERAAALHVRHLQRWPLGTSYPDIVKAVVDLLRQPVFPRDPVLAVDGTGVGRPVVDMFQQAKPALPAYIKPVLIVAGATESFDKGYHHVPKRNLVGYVQEALSNQRLQIAADLPQATVLQRELLNFQMKATPLGNDIYGAWREGTHDDLVLATALALWAAKVSDSVAVFI